MNSASGSQVALKDWIFERATGNLWNARSKQRLPEQARQVLDALLANPGELITRELLIECLWPKVVVDFDTGLNSVMRKLRCALGDDPSRPRYIETIPGKGYRLIGTTRSPDNRAHTSSGAGFDLYLSAKARQPDISIWEGVEPRQSLLELLGRALAIDPACAAAYTVRAHVNLDFFISNLDVSEERLAAVRDDLAHARRFALDEHIGLDVRSLYAAVVDLNPEGALLLTDLAPHDPDVLKSKATILMTLGRYRESNEIFDRFLALDPANQRLLRIKVTNLMGERRHREALELSATLQKLSPPGRNPTAWNNLTAGHTDSAWISVGQMRDTLQKSDADGEHLFTLWPELILLRREHRYRELADLLAVSNAESMRVPPLTGALPGLGRQPVAVIRGWTELLMWRTAAAAISGRKVLEFVEASKLTKWNVWHMRMLQATAQIFIGNSAHAVSLVRDALQDSQRPITNRHMRIYREYLAAITLAWAGEHDESVTLLEKLSVATPSLGPAIIASDPVLFHPLKHNARFEKMRKHLLADF